MFLKHNHIPGTNMPGHRDFQKKLLQGRNGYARFC